MSAARTFKHTIGLKTALADVGAERVHLWLNTVQTTLAGNSSIRAPFSDWRNSSLTPTSLHYIFIRIQNLTSA
jgi:hypothetical protein